MTGRCTLRNAMVVVLHNMLRTAGFSEIRLSVRLRCIPEPGGRFLRATPELSHEPHCEALAVAVDPVTASVDELNAPTQEGGLRQAPANLTQTMGFSTMFCYQGFAAAEVFRLQP